MWIQFFLENFHFAVNLFAALVFFAASWLYLDAWTARKTLKDGLKVLGLLLLSLSYLVHGAFLESTIVVEPLVGYGVHEYLMGSIRIVGYLLFVVGLLIDPILPVPKTEGVEGELSAKKTSMMVSFGTVSAFFYPFLPAVAALLYLRRATIGLEHHLKKVAVGFFAISISELFSLTTLYQQNPNPDVYRLVAPFGPLWVASHVILLLGTFLIGRWVFWYLMSRLMTQLFMIFTASVVLIFLVTTVTFTGLLLSNMQQEAIRQVATDAKVLLFTVDSKKAELVSDVEAFAQNPEVSHAVGEKTIGVLPRVTEQFLVAKHQSLLVVTDDHGVVLARGEDRDKVGDSLSDDPVVKRAVLGSSATSVVATDGVVAPQLSVRAASPIRGSDGKTVVGAVVAGVAIDAAFTDGIRDATGLEAAIYGGNIISATTIHSADGATRLVGIHEEDPRVGETVLKQGSGLAIAREIANIPYFAAYEPLKDVDNTVIGMVFVGKPQIGVFQAAGHSIELTFFVTVVMIMLSVLPAYFIAKSIAYQLQ